MKSKIALSFTVIAFLISFFAFRPVDDPFTELLKKLDAYTTKYPQEKVYLHLDKPYYAIGDDIWFKAYVLNNKTKSPTAISNVLYVELIDENDALKRQLKLPLTNGLTWGDFKLIDSLTEGNYRMRAYTNYMRNLGPEFFFDKTIKIGNGWSNKVFTSTVYNIAADKIDADIRFEDKNRNAYANKEVIYEVQVDHKTINRGRAKTNDKGNARFTFPNNRNVNQRGEIIATLIEDSKQRITKSIPITNTSNHADVQFLPEGGTLIENLPQKIAIKVINGSGKGEDVTGKIIDEKGVEIMSIETAYLGMGSFTINMEEGKTYKAKIKFKDGFEKDFNLPQAKKSGYALAVNNLDADKISIKLLASANLRKGEELKIVVQQGGNIHYVSKTKADKQILITSIPKSKLPTGILQITLFSGDNQPIAERLVYNKNAADLIDVKLNATAVSTSRKGKSTISFDSPGVGTGNFSVSVTNATKLSPDEENESNIISTLNLTSDLTGYIEKPNHYFLSDDLKTARELDNLMLTQGWRRFLWQDIVNNVSPAVTYRPEKSTSISGTVTKGGKPVANGKVMLMTNKDGLFTIDTLTNAEGKFNFDNLAFNDSTRFVVQARTDDDKKFVNIKIDQLPQQAVTQNKNTADIDINVNNTLIKYLEESDNYFNEMTRLGVLEKPIKLNDVVIREKRLFGDYTSNRNGLGFNDHMITSKDLRSCVNLTQCLNGRLPFVTFRNGVPYSTRSLNSPMAIYVDGMPANADFLNILSPNDVESVEVLRSVIHTIIYGSGGAGGVLVITTKRGGNQTNYNNYSAPGIVIVTAKGFSVSRDFYAPKYDSGNTNIAGDYRSTIYWNPRLTAGDDGKVNFDFYNAGEAGTYRVVIEGMDNLGKLARSVFSYDVK